MWSLMLASGVARAGDLAACDAPVPTPEAVAPQMAEAYWLNAHALQWPGLVPQSGARVRLYHARAAGLQAVPGEPVRGADGAIELAPSATGVPESMRFIGDGPRFDVRGVDLAALLREQLLLVLEAADGRVVTATGLQLPGALDDLYAVAERVTDLGAHPGRERTTFGVWAPTAQRVLLCRYAAAESPAIAADAMHFDAATGVWRTALPGDLSGQAYRYLVDVVAPTQGLVRNLVTDPYSVALTANSKRSLVADLGAAAFKPRGWDTHPRPGPSANATDQVIYELHVRDFSASDATVRPAWRGKYLAFTESRSNGMKHLQGLARAGLTDVQLLPVFDFSTVPERGCKSPRVPRTAPDSAAQQSVVMSMATEDCFNWGYDPWHFNTPEGSYATDPLKRIVEFRKMVMALHGAGLRVGMDMVYNHMAAAGQSPRSVLDRLVPGYYHRLNAKGEVERSTCCDNTATEHRMMAKLMIDSAALWVREYRIDSMRFDLMGHQPREAMERLQARVNAEAGRAVRLLGEGWNFGEVASGARFVQASQLSLNGSGIATFSDRARDAARGRGDEPGARGWLNGGADGEAADMIRVGLAGSLRDFELVTWQGEKRRLERIAYGDQPAGYAGEPGEVVNYVENHDNRTLFDINILKLAPATSSADRARVQMLGAALVAFSQGVAYFHAGQDILRSKSLDRNSYDSGDWFNRLDWSYRDNGFGAGLPPRIDNGQQWAQLRPLLAEAGLKPRPVDITWTRDVFRDLLRIRASTPLLRLPSAAEIRRRVSFPGSGPGQNPALVAVRIDGAGYAGAGFRAVLVLLNTASTGQVLALPGEAGRDWRLHPAQRRGADARLRRSAGFEAGRFAVPARSAAVFVLP